MYKYEFTKQAIKDIKKLPKNIQQKIITKLDYFISSNNPLLYLLSAIEKKSINNL